MAERMFFLIESSEDGDAYLSVFDEEQMLAHLNESTDGGSPRKLVKLSELEVLQCGYYNHIFQNIGEMRGALIIEGKVAEPKAVEVTTKWEI